MYILFFVLGVGVGVGAMWVFGKMRKSDLSAPAGYLPMPGEKDKVIYPEQVKQHQENLEKILQLVREQGGVDAGMLMGKLGISATTAERYFNELEAQGKIVQVGTTGQSVYYQERK